MASKNFIKAIEAFAKEYEENLKTLAPKRSGRLKDSIKTFVDVQAETVKAGVEMVYYGEFVKKKGTHNREYNPFKDEAWAETKFNTQVEEALLAEIESMFDKVFVK